MIIKRIENARLRLEGRSGRWAYRFQGREDGTVLRVFPLRGFDRRREGVPVIYYSGDPGGPAAPRSYLGWRGGPAESLRVRDAQLVTYRVEDFVRFSKMGGLSELEIWERTTWDRAGGEFDPYDLGLLKSQGRTFKQVLTLAWHHPEMFKAESARYRRAFA